MSKYVLIKECRNYADEFDTYGFTIISMNEWDQIKLETKALFDTKKNGIEVYFGTNEAHEYYDYADWLGSLQVKELTEQEADTIIAAFGGSDWGDVCGLRLLEV